MICNRALQLTHFVYEINWKFKTQGLSTKLSFSCMQTLPRSWADPQKSTFKSHLYTATCCRDRKSPPSICRKTYFLTHSRPFISPRLGISDIAEHITPLYSTAYFFAAKWKWYSFGGCAQTYSRAERKLSSTSLFVVLYLFHCFNFVFDDRIAKLLVNLGLGQSM